MDAPDAPDAPAAGDATPQSKRLRAARSLVKLVKAEEAFDDIQCTLEAMRAAHVREFGDVLRVDRDAAVAIPAVVAGTPAKRLDIKRLEAVCTRKADHHWPGTRMSYLAQLQDVYNVMHLNDILATHQIKHQPPIGFQRLAHDVMWTPGDDAVFFTLFPPLRCNVGTAGSNVYKCPVCGTRIGGYYLYDPRVGADRFHPACAALVAMCP